jgi:hypothetical protein
VSPVIYPLLFFAGMFSQSAIADFARGYRRRAWVYLFKAAGYIGVAVYLVCRHGAGRP